MENSTSLKQEQENQKPEEAEEPWQGESEASPQDPGPLSPEYREEEQRSNTELPPRMSPSWALQSRASLSLEDLTVGQGGSSSLPSPPLTSHFIPPMTATIQDPVASSQGERFPTGTPHSDPWEPFSAARQSTSYYRSQTEESTFLQPQAHQPDLRGTGDVSRDKSKHKQLRFDLLQEEDSNSNCDPDQPEFRANEAAPNMLEVAVQNAKAYLLQSSSKSGLNV